MKEITSVACRRGCSNGCYELRIGSACIGTVTPADGGWYAYPEHDAPATWHPYEADAVHAVVHAHTGGGSR